MGSVMEGSNSDNNSRMKNKRCQNKNKSPFPKSVKLKKTDIVVNICDEKKKKKSRTKLKQSSTRGKKWRSPFIISECAVAATGGDDESFSDDDIKNDIYESDFIDDDETKN